MSSHAPDTNADLLQISKEIQDQMIEQKNENEEMRQEIQQVKEENYRLIHERCSNKQSDAHLTIKVDGPTPEFSEKKRYQSEEYEGSLKDIDPKIRDKNHQRRHQRFHRESVAFIW